MLMALENSYQQESNDFVSHRLIWREVAENDGIQNYCSLEGKFSSVIWIERL